MMTLLGPDMLLSNYYISCVNGLYIFINQQQDHYKVNFKVTMEITNQDRPSETRCRVTWYRGTGVSGKPTASFSIP